MPIIEECCGFVPLGCVPEYFYIVGYVGNEFVIDPDFAVGNPFFQIWTKPWGGMFKVFDPDANITCLGEPGVHIDRGGFRTPDGTAGTADNNTNYDVGADGAHILWGSFPAVDPCTWRLDLTVRQNYDDQGVPPFTVGAVWSGYKNNPHQGKTVPFDITFTRDGGFDTRATVTLRDTLTLPVQKVTVIAAGITDTFAVNSYYSWMSYSGGSVFMQPESLAAWITTPIIGVWTGNTTISYTVAANGTGLARKGMIRVGCNYFTIHQNA